MDDSQVAQTVKNLPTVRETQVQPLGWEDPLEKGRAPTPVFLPGEVHGQRSLAGYSPWGCKELDMTERLTHVHIFTWVIHFAVQQKLISQYKATKLQFKKKLGRSRSAGLFPVLVL